MSSTPLNSTYTWTEFQNLTGTDNVFEVLYEINNWLGGAFGIFLWLGLVILSFMISIYTSNEPKKALLIAFFTGTVIGVPLYMIGLIPGMIMYFSLATLLIMLVVIKATN